MASSSCQAVPTTPKQVIQLLVNENSQRITFLKSSEESGTVRKSDVWQKFDGIALDGLPVDYVACKTCKVVLGHKSRGGTTGLRHHKCIPVPGAVRAQITVQPSDDVKEKEIPASLQKDVPIRFEVVSKIKEDCIRFVAKDLRPYEIIQGEGFKSLAQMFVLIGAHYGNIDIGALGLLPEPAVIHLSLSQVAEQIRIRMIDELQACQHVAISTDFWNDITHGNGYMTVSANYYLEDGAQLNLRTRILATKRVDNLDAGEALWKALENIIHQYDLATEKLTLVTDNDQLKTWAAKSINALSSAVSQLNRILNRVVLSGEMPRIKKLIVAVNNLVFYIKQLKIEEFLNLQLEENLPNNWGGITTKMLFIKANYKSLCQHPSLKGETIFDEVDEDVLATMVDFLQPFKEAFEQLCQDVEPTLHLVIPWLHQLKACCEAKVDDDEILKFLKNSTLKFLESDLKIEDIYSVATTLNPRMKGLTFLPALDRLNAHESLRRLVSASKMLNGNCEDDASTSPSPPPEKKIKLEKLENLCDAVEECETDEVDLYLQHKVSPKIGSVTIFWEQHRIQYPNLFNVIQRILCVPASTSAGERPFHGRSRILEDRRTHLSPSSVDNVLVLQSISNYL